MAAVLDTDHADASLTSNFNRVSHANITCDMSHAIIGMEFLKRHGEGGSVLNVIDLETAAVREITSHGDSLSFVALDAIPLLPESWELLSLQLGLVLALELVNTAGEQLVDLLHPEHDPRWGRIKDLLAGASLVAALAAAVVGVLVFGPRLWG